ncbi:MAG: hypothetical protein ACPHID_06560 [Thermoplasmatota archaeon]
MKNRVILLSMVFLLSLVAMPAQAGPDCDRNPSHPDCSGNGPEDLEEYCARNPDAKRCASAVGDSICNVVIVHIGTPSPVWDPLLGLIEFNPDACYEVFVFSPTQKPPVMYLRYGAA